MPRIICCTVKLFKHTDLASVIICRKYGDPRMILEVGYNLTYSWHKYSCDADCCLVLKMLMGKLPPSKAIPVVCCTQRQI